MSGHNKIKFQHGRLQVLGKVSLYVVDTQVIWWYLIEYFPDIGLSFIGFMIFSMLPVCH